MTIANVFVDSQDDIRLILLLMYKTIIIILLLLLGGLLLLGYQIATLFYLSAALHTHAQMRIKAKVYFGRPRLHTVIKRARGQSHTQSECRQFFETAQVKLVVLRMCSGVQTCHLSAKFAVFTLK